MQIKDLRLTAKLPDGKPFELKKRFEVGGLAGALGRRHAMARLKSELEVGLPLLSGRSWSSTPTSAASCRIGSRIAGTSRSSRRATDPGATKPRGARAIFQQSVDAEKTRGDALSKRFEEALRQANEEPITKPMRDFDLD